MKWFGKDQGDPDKDIRDAYRRVFLTPEGKIAFAYLLIDLGYFEESKNEEEVVRKNFAIRLQEQLGILHEFNAVEYVDRILSLPVYIEDKEQKKHGN